MIDQIFHLPHLGSFEPGDGFIPLDRCSDGVTLRGRNGVVNIFTTQDQKVEFIAYSDHTIAYVSSALGYPAYYPVHPVEVRRPLQAVLMDLDGTSVHSETFWIWIIQKTIASVLRQPGFELEEADLPFVSGHSVSEHLQYCIQKYCPGVPLEEARRQYFDHTHHEMQAILAGRGRTEAFTPAPGLKEFLLTLKDQKIRIGLVTSGLSEKAYPEILSAFQMLGLGAPEDFYDAILCAGTAPGQGRVGTLGELEPKPHPWLYAETCRVGLGIPFESRGAVIGIEDSGAGVCSLRLAGLAAAGIAGGNIMASGTRPLCQAYAASLLDLLPWVLHGDLPSAHHRTGV